jgi:hypothetical protein
MPFIVGGAVQLNNPEYPNMTTSVFADVIGCPSCSFPESGQSSTIAYRAVVVHVYLGFEIILVCYDVSSARIMTKLQAYGYLYYEVN